MYNLLTSHGNEAQVNKLICWINVYCAWKGDGEVERKGSPEPPPVICCHSHWGPNFKLDRFVIVSLWLLFAFSFSSWQPSWGPAVESIVPPSTHTAGSYMSQMLGRALARKFIFCDSDSTVFHSHPRVCGRQLSSQAPYAAYVHQYNLSSHSTVCC